MSLETHAVSGKAESHQCDLLALLVRENFAKSGEARFAGLDEAVSGLVKRVAQEEEFTGKEGQQLSLHTHGKAGAQRILVLGLGRDKDADKTLDQLRQAASRAVKVARAAGAR